MLEAATTVAAEPQLSPARAAPPEPDVASIVPPQPKTIRDTGLDRQLVLALLSKAIHAAGKAHLPVLAGKLRLSISVLREALDLMLAEQLVEVAWRGDSDIDVQYQLTGGRQGARRRLPGAVPLRRPGAGHARRLPRRAGARRRSASRRPAASAPPNWPPRSPTTASTPAVRDQLGAALHSGRAVLLHGPSGSGKSTLARKLGRLLQGVVGGAVRDAGRPADRPVLRSAAAPGAAAAAGAPVRRAPQRHALGAVPAAGGAGRRRAERARCSIAASTRPTASITRRPISRPAAACWWSTTWAASACRRAELLNRFIGPLDYGTDVLTLQGGHAETVPFDVTLVFATNLAPQSVLDEPLLRRIGYKIHARPAQRGQLPRAAAAPVRRAAGAVRR